MSKGELRRKHILESLQRDGTIRIADIMERYGCSEATARRDLAELADSRAGLVRTIGGAHYEAASPLQEATFQEKKGRLWEEKARIARMAASFVREGDIVGLTGGTTTYWIAKSLRGLERITVVTNAVNIAMELADRERIQVVLTGGVMRGRTFELSGPLAESVAAQLNIGIMFVGVDGFSLARGLTTYSEDEAQINRLLIRRADKVVAVFDHTKVRTSSLFTIAPVSSVHACITDRPFDPELESALRAMNIETYFAAAAQHGEE